MRSGCNEVLRRQTMLIFDSLQVVARHFTKNPLLSNQEVMQLDVGKKLKEKRLEADYTQKDLAEILHVTRQTISSWEVGRTYPDLDVLIAISELYDTSLDDLLKEDSEMVKDITNKVKKSERRKVLNIILGAVIAVMFAIGLLSLWEGYQNNQANDHGLKPSDIYESTWEISYTPLKMDIRSFMSFSKDSIVFFDTLEPELLPPSLNLDDLSSMIKEEVEGKVWEASKQAGLTSLLRTYENIEVEIDDDVYFITAQGYAGEFKRISDTVIRTFDGTEYRKIDSKSSHGMLRSIAKEFDE